LRRIGDTSFEVRRAIAALRVDQTPAETPQDATLMKTVGILGELVERFEDGIGVAQCGKVAAGIAEERILDRKAIGERKPDHPHRRARLLEALARVVNAFGGLLTLVEQLIARGVDALHDDSRNRHGDRFALLDRVSHQSAYFSCARTRSNRQRFSKIAAVRKPP
jgi:hypothetical protein